MPIIFLLLLAVPIIELMVIVYAAQAIGTPVTLVMLVVISLVGAWLVKVEGLGVWRRFATTISQGKVPHREIVDGVLILVAGALMLTPGFVTDGVGLLLLAPPSRAVVRRAVVNRVTGGLFVGAPVAGRFVRDVWDTSGTESNSTESYRTESERDDAAGPPPGLER